METRNRIERTPDTRNFTAHRELRDSRPLDSYTHDLQMALWREENGHTLTEIRARREAHHRALRPAQRFSRWLRGES